MNAETLFMNISPWCVLYVVEMGTEQKRAKRREIQTSIQ